MADIVGLQLYTVRDETAKNFKQTIRTVAEIGYAGVEFAGYGELSAKEMKTLLAETGLRALGTHVSLTALEADFDREVDYCVEIGSPFLIIPWLEAKLRTGDALKTLTERLNIFGEHSQQKNVTLAYHNHDFEFQKEGEGTFFDHLLAATQADLVKIELDTYWAAFAGVDPVKFMQQYTGRIATLHLKDMTAERTFTEVGDGTLDIASYRDAGKQAGAHFFIVENDQPRIPSLESARRSFENIHRSLT